MRKKDTLDELHFQVLKRPPTPTEIRRAEILQGVVQILAVDGVDELTFETIGRQVGMARSHVVYYFKNRNELVMAAIQFSALSAQRIILAHMEGATDWEKQLQRYIEGNFLWIRQCPEHATVYGLLYYFSRLKPQYRKLHSDIREVGAKRIESILELSPLKGKKRRIRTLAKAIQGLITGNLVDVMTTDQAGLSEQRQQETIAFVGEWTRSLK